MGSSAAASFSPCPISGRASSTRSSCAETARRSAPTRAPHYRDALAAHRAACAARAAGPIRDLLDALLRPSAATTRRAKRDVSGVDFEDLELLTLELLRARPSCVSAMRSALSGSWSMSNRTPTASSSS